LDLQTGVWSQGASRPVAAHGFEIETCGKNQIYAFGGFAYSEDHNPKWKSLNRVDKYDPVTDTWTQVATMPRARSSNVAAQVGNKIYLIGGWDSTPKSDGDYEGRFHREIDVFNCETEKFENSNLEIPDPLRRAFTGVSIGDKILLIGGLGVGASHFELLDNVTEFDPQSGTFKELAPLPFATFAPAAGVKDGSLFVFGGMYKTGEMNYEYVNHVYKLNGSAWENTGRHLLESKGFAVVVPVADSMLVIGGHSYKDGNDAPVPTIESFN
ncbi:MAG: hypothetical protein KDD25_02385, partial [Bdellovibrionales bacterium]|nr:hypothetical protein [Bdellovibrionales bacterium]